jgi:hypothetical protein
VLAVPAHSGASLTIRLGDATVLPVALPVLGGLSEENLFPTAEPLGVSGGFTLYRAGPWLLGHTSRVPGTGLEPETRQLYGELLAATAGRHLCRIWNYVPAINAIGADGLENYRAFSRGRSMAFEAAAGPEFKRWLPAASAVGSADHHLTVLFAAHTTPPLHRENPEQVPAYDYPPEHGPRSPSFARASIVPRTDGRRDVFLSGTSSIKGHITVAPGDTLAQTLCTLKNLRAIARACNLGDDYGRDAVARHIKVYLRHAADQSVVAQQLEHELLQSRDAVTYLAADVCRAALNVEIEVTVFGAA